MNKLLDNHAINIINIKNIRYYVATAQDFHSKIR